jgi:hypothetical protein
MNFLITYFKAERELSKAMLVLFPIFISDENLAKNCGLTEHSVTICKPVSWHPMCCDVHAMKGYCMKLSMEIT